MKYYLEIIKSMRNYSEKPVLKQKIEKPEKCKKPLLIKQFRGQILIRNSNLFDWLISTQRLKKNNFFLTIKQLYEPTSKVFPCCCGSLSKLTAFNFLDNVGVLGLCTTKTGWVSVDSVDWSFKSNTGKFLSLLIVMVVESDVSIDSVDSISIFLVLQALSFTLWQNNWWTMSNLS